MEFHPDQRWTSETEPELGIGIVTETSKGRVKIHFPIAEETRLYATASAPLRRVVFKPGDTVSDSNGRSLVVEEVEERDQLYVYLGSGKAMSEADLGEMVVSHGADDRLLMGEVDTPAHFSLRRRTLEKDHYRRISPVKGFMGGRIDLIPHQLYISHEVSSRFAPRILLSDEVGLGKTIEACLILHRLLLTGSISRVLILVPESLVHQWFVEMLRRFNLWFHIFDEERCASIEEGAPEGNPFLANQWILCSTDFLAGSETRSAQALSAGWDLLVVDEAHHLEWSVTQASREYQVVEALSQQAAGLLLLTATPEQLGPESHFARLRLLDTTRYADFEAFQNESLDQKQTADLVVKLADGETPNKADIKLLGTLLEESQIAQKPWENEESRNYLIQDLLDRYGPGRVVFRNRRSAMQGFPERKAHLIPLEAQFSHDFWLEKVAAEFEAELRLTAGTLVRKSFSFERDPRLDWLVQFLEGINPAKVLLICNAKQKVLALEKALAERISLKVGVFHEDLTLVQRDRNAAWFSEPDGARLLLCSEIGSEGRNFQFAHHLVLFDLPLLPELLEQRIGRLDRIGQRSDIHIHVPYLAGSPQEILVRWYHEGLNAFEKNLEGGQRIAQQFGDRVQKLALEKRTEETEQQLAELIGETRTYHAKLVESLASGRDRLLEMNSFRPEIAEEIIGQIQLEDKTLELETYMLEVFDAFHIHVEDLAPRTYALYARQGNAQAFPEIPDEGITVTFDRKRALSKEEISFITWDHPMVSGAFDLVLGSPKGNASYGKLKGSGTPALLLEAIFVLETAGEASKTVDRFLPRTPIRLVIDQDGMEVTEFYEVEEWDRQLRPGFWDDLEDHFLELAKLIPRMLETVTELAEEQAMMERARGLRKMNSTLNHEISRLEALSQKNSHIRPVEIELAEKEHEKLKNMITDSALRLDSVQFVQKGDYWEEG